MAIMGGVDAAADRRFPSAALCIGHRSAAQPPPLAIHCVVRTWPQLGTPLAVAAHHGRVEAVAALLAAGANKDAATKVSVGALEVSPPSRPAWQHHAEHVCRSPCTTHECMVHGRVEGMVLIPACGLQGQLVVIGCAVGCCCLPGVCLA